MEDTRISWKAKGVLLCMRSLNNTTELPIDESLIDYDALLKNSKDGQWALKSALRELRKAGYLVKSKPVEMVYLVKSEWSGFYKIGYTSAVGVEFRLIGMRTGDPSLKLIAKKK